MGRQITREGYIFLTKAQITRLSKGMIVSVQRNGVKTLLKMNSGDMNKIRKLREKIAKLNNKLASLTSNSPAGKDMFDIG